MNETPMPNVEQPETGEEMDAHLLETARAFAYPATPDIAARVLKKPAAPGPIHFRRLAWVILVVFVSSCIVLSVLLTVPEVRAAVLNVLHIGSVTIFITPPTATPTALPTATSTNQIGSSTPIRPTPSATPSPTVTLLPSLLNLVGATTLADAQRSVAFPIKLPSYPADLGAPDRVYQQTLGGPMIILVWLDASRPDGVRMSLHLLSEQAIAYKSQPKIIHETTVLGQRAVWTEGPYLVEIKVANGSEWELRRLINGHVLIWTEGKVTYRLETDLSLDEAVKIAELLR